MKVLFSCSLADYVSLLHILSLQSAGTAHFDFPSPDSEADFFFVIDPHMTDVQSIVVKARRASDG